MILIAGATGFVGRALVRRLAAERREVRCLLRPSRREQQLAPGIPFSTVSASMSDLPALRTAMQDVTAVVHLTAAEDLYHGKTLSSHVKDTVNLIAAIKETDVRRFIYLSRLGADRASAYSLFRTKGEAEAAVRESGLDHTIFRTAVTYGSEDVFTNMLVMLAKMTSFVLPIPDTSLARFQPLWIGDLVACIAAVLDRNDLIGQTILLGGPEHFTLDQMMAQVLAAAGMRRRLVRVRMPLVQGAIGLFDALLPRNPVPYWWVDILSKGSATELGAVSRCFGFEPGRFAQHLDYLRGKRPWRRDLVRLVFTPPAGD
ncbi:MAG: NAD(P)H-binding protein [Anaerolineae bacterium]|nr:NAD(P)H-binding protein [Anaerolineae bacterium]